MPDQHPIEPGPDSEADRTRTFAPADDPRWRYRVTTYAADDVAPPKVGGAPVEQTCHTEYTRSVRAAVAAARDDAEVGSILVEERLTDDVAMQGPRAGWRVLIRFTRTAEGWSHS